MKVIIIALVFTLISGNVLAQSKKRTKISYKKRQKIDLGALLIDGELVSPGDFSVQDEKQKASELLFKRKNHNDRLRINIEYVCEENKMECERFNLLNTGTAFFSDGGAYMWIILMVWITGLGLSVYKFFMLKRNDIKNNKLFDMIKGNVLNNDVEGAINLCSNTKAVLPKILRSGLKRANEDRQLVEDALSTSIMEHAPRITYHLSYISLIANVSTLIGLLGTIQGLIISFSGVAGADPGEKAKILAEGIAKAMNTTAFGLISAITIMVLHTILTNKAIRINDKIDEISGKLLDLLSVKRRKQ